MLLPTAETEVHEAKMRENLCLEDEYRIQYHLGPFHLFLSHTKTNPVIILLRLNEIQVNIK